MPLPKNVEILKNMNSTNGKFATWHVRVLEPKIIEYEFKSRQETVIAERFECILVSKDPSQYMLAGVPFSFNDRQAARKALAEYKKNDVIEITTPAMDSKARPDFNGCPVKSVLLLTRPTTIKHVPCTHVEMLQHPAQCLQVSLSITALIEHLKVLGSDKSTKTLDFCGKVLGVSLPKAKENTKQ